MSKEKRETNVIFQEMVEREINFDIYYQEKETLGKFFVFVNKLATILIFNLYIARG